jgi:hypothetical protein
MGLKLQRFQIKPRAKYLAVLPQKTGMNAFLGCHCDTLLRIAVESAAV